MMKSNTKILIALVHLHLKLVDLFHKTSVSCMMVVMMIDQKNNLLSMNLMNMKIQHYIHFVNYQMNNHLVKMMRVLVYFLLMLLVQTV